MKSHSSTHYRRNSLSTGAIYPSSKNARYVALLSVTKFLTTIAVFLSYDVLKVIHVVQFLLITKAIAVIPFFLLQKPLSSGKPITKNQWIRITRHAFLNCVITLMWLFGLTQCGPLRTVLLSEHNDIIVVAAVSSLFTGVGGHSKFRGAICFAIGVMSLLLFDNDNQTVDAPEHPEGHHHQGISHIYYKLVSWIGMADHKVGVLLLLLTLLLQTGFNAAAKRLSIDIGGSKRLHAVSSFVSVIILAPLAVIVSLLQQIDVESWLSLSMPCVAVSFLYFVVDYYIEAICIGRLNVEKTSCYGSIAMFFSSILMSFFWSQSGMVIYLPFKVGQEHILSFGVLFSFIMFSFATVILSSTASKFAQGRFIGYSESGLPLYSFSGGNNPQMTSEKIIFFVKSLMKQIMDESDSRKIFYFLCINLLFTFVEMLYGLLTNSLGLLSDGFHMLFDCSALVMGLCASLMSRWKATRMISYGYGRVEVLSGFVNCLFLVVIAYFVFTEALHRLVDPPHINTNKLLPVSIIGLLVNLIGILVFRHAHSHHGHSHHGHSHNTNMQGVFLHILADTLGSIGVIISTLLIENFDLMIADPICSIFIASLIFLSVLPLLKESSYILLLKSPDDEKKIERALKQVMKIKGVISYRNQHFWEQVSNVPHGMINIQLMPETSEQTVLQQAIPIFKSAGFFEMTIQLEKEECYQHLSALSSSLSVVFDATEQAAIMASNKKHINSASAVKAV